MPVPLVLGNVHELLDPSHEPLLQPWRDQTISSAGAIDANLGRDLVPRLDVLEALLGVPFEFQEQVVDLVVGQLVGHVVLFSKGGQLLSPASRDDRVLELFPPVGLFADGV